MDTEVKNGFIEPALANEVRRAQATSIQERLPATLLVNLVVAVSAVAVSVVDDGLTYHMILWFLVVVATLLFRGMTCWGIARNKIIQKSPEKAIRIVTLGAALSGIAWAALPYCVKEFRPLGADGGIYLMMGGIAAGAVLIGIGHSTISLAFALPVLVSVALTLVAADGMAAWLYAFNVFALIAIVTRSSRKSESIFISNVVGKLKATALANSLATANADILQANYRLEVLASRDPLTGLANRAAFNKALAAGISEAFADNGQMALIILDLDHFKLVNDTLGHSAGDELLVKVTDKLRYAADGKGTIARLGGDEFAVIITGPDAAPTARDLCARMVEEYRQPVMLAGHPVVTGVSAGLALFPVHADTAEDLFISADMALYRAKERGRRQWREFQLQFRSQSERRHQIEQDLAAALKNQEIQPWFQPQVDLVSLEVTGFEALMRWHHPYLGSISPAEIVAAAHATNLSDQLTTGVAAAACRLLNRLPSLGLPHATVAINVSPLEFDLYCVSDVLERVTKAHGIDPRLFEIEITEEAILDTLVAGEQLKSIGRSGYKLAVDDFGAGHSSLAYLVSLKVDRLKLDRRFVIGIHCQQNQEIVGAMVALGRSLAMEVLVEGVESEDEAGILRALGVQVAQGYFFGRPMPAEHIDAWLESRGNFCQRAVA